MSLLSLQSKTITPSLAPLIIQPEPGIPSSLSIIKTKLLRQACRRTIQPSYKKSTQAFWHAIISSFIFNWSKMHYFAILSVAFASTALAESTDFIAVRERAVLNNISTDQFRLSYMALVAMQLKLNATAASTWKSPSLLKYSLNPISTETNMHRPIFLEIEVVHPNTCELYR